MLVMDHESFYGMDEKRESNETLLLKASVRLRQDRRENANRPKLMGARCSVSLLVMFVSLIALGQDSLWAQDGARTSPGASDEAPNRPMPFVVDEETLRIMRERNAFATRPFEPIDERFEEASPTPPVSEQGLSFRYEPQLKRIKFGDPIHGQWITGELGYHVHALDLLHVFRLTPRPSYSSERIIPRLPADVLKEVGLQRMQLNQLIGTNKSPTEADLEEFDRQVQSVIDLLVETLGEEKVIKVQQTGWQQTMFETTLPQMLLVGWLGEQLEITDEQKTLIREQLEVEIEMMRREFIELERSQFRAYREVLSPEDWAVLESRFDDVQAWEALPLPSYAFVYDNHRYCRAFRSLLLEPPAPNRRMIIAGRDDAVARGRSLFFDSSLVQEYLELDDSDIRAMRQAKTDLELGALQRQFDVRAAQEDGGDEQIVESLNEELNSLRRQLPNAHLQGLEGETRLRGEYLLQLHHIRGGSFARELLEGDLWQEFALTEQERRDVLDLHIAAAELTRSGHRRIMDEHFERMVDLLHTDQQQILRATIGPWNENLIPGEPQAYMDIMSALARETDSDESERTRNR